MGLLMNLFGQKLTVRFEGTTIDGQPFTGKTKIEVIGIGNKEVEKYLKRAVYVETGKHVQTLKIVAAV
jgi:hypothetical protein